MTKRKEEGINDELIDKLIKERGYGREAILGEKGLVAELTRRVVERALAGELTHHLGYAKGEEKPEGKEDNHRNATAARR